MEVPVLAARASSTCLGFAVSAVATSLVRLGALPVFPEPRITGREGLRRHHVQPHILPGAEGSEGGRVWATQQAEGTWVSFGFGAKEITGRRDFLNPHGRHYDAFQW